MKTQVIYLEPQDNLHTTQDKINWGKSERILLVYPTSSPPLHRKIDLIRLERFSRQSGAQFAVVTNREEIANFAREIGISVFPNRRVAQLADWNQPQANIKNLDFSLSSKEEKFDLKQKSSQSDIPDWLKNKYIRFGIISIAIITVFSLLIFLLPSAEIQISPITFKQNIMLNLEVDPEVQNFNLAGVVPAELITVTVETEKTISTTGRILIPYKFASTINSYFVTHAH